MISHILDLQVFKSRIFLSDLKAMSGTLELVIQLIFEGTADSRGGIFPFKLLAKP
jgi:hypothetical protein